MRKVFLILKWASVLALFIVVLSFTNSRQEQQFVSFDKISVLVSEDNFVNEKITEIINLIIKFNRNIIRRMTA